MRTMIAQDTDRTGDSMKERRIGPYGRLKRIPCAVRRQARASAIHEKFGLGCGSAGRRDWIDYRERIPSASTPTEIDFVLLATVYPLSVEVRSSCKCTWSAESGRLRGGASTASVQR